MLTVQERKGKQLSKINDIKIKPSNKGGNVVIWPICLYEKEALKQLHDKSYYKQLFFNPLQK